MAIRQIRTKGDEVLRKKSRVIEEINDRLLILIEDMLDTMYEAEGVGLAAPQVGILKRVVVIDIGEGPIVLINPEIIESRGSYIDVEGCLSIPNEQGYVERPEYVKVKALNERGESIIVEGEDFLAKAICHELDHLDGVLYIDKLVEVEEK
ncbi:peptide deformylase [Oceanirhabdus sp. W0125-5]|uniref:peptide deformylase n=1 Tax=Oceanirhabdus sp. W0125-5 TaxID=2999116 RepID=UPI0022F2BEAD|nr:peptide deformylase [Oceanirhabdus sp. W0125-5]WBW94780.1 peptide deformylase [Oceanirhabdus sp. W0125-5]